MGRDIKNKDNHDQELKIFVGGDTKLTRVNSMITAKYQSTLTENKLMAWALKTASIDAHGRPSVSMTTADIRKLTGVSGNSIYDTIKKCAANMIGRSMYMEETKKDGTKRFDFINLIHRASFENGIFTVNFTPECKDMIYNLSRDFTTLDLPILFSLTSNDSYRLYEILSIRRYMIDSNNTPISIEYPLSVLKLELNCINIEEPKIREELNKSNPDFDKIVNELASVNKFSRWGDFKNYVLNKAVKEINEKTDLFCEFEAIKSGRGGKVQGVIFRIQKNVGQKSMIYPKDLVDATEPELITTEEMKRSKLISDVMSILEDVIISQKDAINLLKIADNDLEKIKKAYALSKKQKHIKNLIGWLTNAIRNDYEEEIEIVNGSLEETKNAVKQQEIVLASKQNLALKAWEMIKKRPNFNEFMEYIRDTEGLDQDLFEILHGVKECNEIYTEWFKTQK